MLTRKQFEQLDEDDLREKVLAPLLVKMGFRGVQIVHRSNEKGKDLIAWRIDNIDEMIAERRNIAFVVKKGRIDGRADLGKGTANVVCFQVSQCFSTTYNDPDTGAICIIHDCWIVTNGAILPNATETIASELASRGRDRNIRFVDGSRLWKLYVKYFPIEGFWNNLHEVVDALPQDEHYSIKVTAANGATSKAIRISLEEKYPGAASAHPLETNMLFSFPDTEAGQVLRVEYDRFVAEGGKIEIPAAYVEQLEVPELMRELFSLDVFGKPNVVLESPPKPLQLQVRLEVEQENGETFFLPYLELRLVQSGQVQAVLNNHHQPIPIKLAVILDAVKKTIQFKFKFDGPPVNVKQIVDWGRLTIAMSKNKTVRLVSLDTGLPLIRSQIGMSPLRVDDGFIEFVEEMEDLLRIQERTNTAITIPDRRFTRRENKMINILRTVLHNQQLTGSWKTFWASIYPPGIRIILDTVEQTGKKLLAVEEDETEELFGIQIPMGRVRRTYRDVQIVDEESVRRQLAISKSDDVAIKVYFQPGEDATLTWDYLNWQAGTGPINEKGTISWGIEAEENLDY
jgi:hypothetical protein